jgi:hypothetical protein
MTCACGQFSGARAATWSAEVRSEDGGLKFHNTLIVNYLCDGILWGKGSPKESPECGSAQQRRAFSGRQGVGGGRAIDTKQIVYV